MFVNDLQTVISKLTYSMYHHSIGWLMNVVYMKDAVTAFMLKGYFRLWTSLVWSSVFIKAKSITAFPAENSSVIWHLFCPSPAVFKDSSLSLFTLVLCFLREIWTSPCVSA